MLENTVLIDGQKGKDLKKLCHDYMVASGVEKDASTTKTTTSNLIKSICNGEKEITEKTVFETMDYIITMSFVKEKHGEFNKDYLKEKYPEIYEECCNKVVPCAVRLANIKEK